MASDNTLSLDGFRRDLELPMAAVETVNHPELAAAARARIAQLTETFPLEQTAEMPSLPPTELVTDRERLRASLVQAPASSRPVLPSAVQPIFTAIGIFLLMLVLFKSPIILSQISYAFHKPATPAAAPATVASVIPSDPTITIPKINVHAPVIYEPSTDEATFETALESGVVHYGNTALPGQNGNVAIFGHSSNDWWQPGNYKFVFVLLDKLAPGDQISIDYQGKRYTYEVTGSSVVDPTDVAVLNPTPTPTLSLITCTPPGTSWKRLVVTAKQIDPSPSITTTATPTPAPVSTNSLSSGSSGLFDQIGHAWDTFTHGVSSLFGGKSSGAKATPTPTAGQPASLPAAD